MTENQIQDFYCRQAKIDSELVRAEMIKKEAYDQDRALKMSCDHRFENGKIAGPEFAGSYCGFICLICKCGVSYEKMGH